MLQYKPSSVEVEFEAPTDFTSTWFIRSTWHPFEAACILCGAIDFRQRDAKLYVVFPIDLAERGEYGAYELPGGDSGAIRELISLANVVSEEHRGATEVDPSAVLRWALRKGLISSDHDAVRAVIGTDPAIAFGTSVTDENSAASPGHGATPDKAESPPNADHHSPIRRENVLRCLLREIVLASKHFSISHREASRQTRLSGVELATALDERRDVYEDILGTKDSPEFGTTYERLCELCRWVIGSPKVTFRPTPRALILRAAIRAILHDPNPTRFSWSADGLTNQAVLSEMLAQQRAAYGLSAEDEPGFSVHDISTTLAAV